MAELTPHAGKLKKVWVCGPPILNQTFDMALGKNKEALKLTTEQIDILWTRPTDFSLLNSDLIKFTYE